MTDAAPIPTYVLKFMGYGLAIMAGIGVAIFLDVPPKAIYFLAFIIGLSLYFLRTLYAGVKNTRPEQRLSALAPSTSAMRGLAKDKLIRGVAIALILFAVIYICSSFASHAYWAIPDEVKNLDNRFVNILYLSFFSVNAIAWGAICIWAGFKLFRQEAALIKYRPIMIGVCILFPFQYVYGTYKNIEANLQLHSSLGETLVVMKPALIFFLLQFVSLFLVLVTMTLSFNEKKLNPQTFKNMALSLKTILILWAVFIVLGLVNTMGGPEILFERSVVSSSETQTIIFIKGAVRWLLIPALLIWCFGFYKNLSETLKMNLGYFFLAIFISLILFIGLDFKPMVMRLSVYNNDYFYGFMTDAGKLFTESLIAWFGLICLIRPGLIARFEQSGIDRNANMMER